jgi:hypothetical protein
MAVSAFDSASEEKVSKECSSGVYRHLYEKFTQKPYLGKKMFHGMHVYTEPFPWTLLCARDLRLHLQPSVAECQPFLRGIQSRGIEGAFEKGHLSNGFRQQ